MDKRDQPPQSPEGGIMFPIRLPAANSAVEAGLRNRGIHPRMY